MGAILILISLIFSVSIASAQTPLAKRAFEEATRLAEAGEFERAVKGYRSVIAAGEEEKGEFAAKVRYNLGVCYYRTGQLKAASKELNTAIRISGDDHHRAYYALGMTETALENWPAAKAAFLKAIELKPDDGEAWFDLAFVYLAEHDYQRAAVAFRRSIENRSVDAALGHNNLGVIIAMSFRFDDAAVEFERALDMSNGRLIAARSNLAFCKGMRGGRVKELLAVSDLTFAVRGWNT